LGASVLWGRDCVEYGEVAVSRPADQVALALTRGLYPKPYAWTDDNEDDVAAVIGKRATALLVADGHNGAVSSEVALGIVLDRFGEDPPPDLTDDELIDLFVAAGDAVLDATRAKDGQHDSRTTLSVALVGERSVRWAAIGDSPIFVMEEGRGRELTEGVHRFVGWPMRRSGVDATLQRGRVTLSAGGWVALASDGFSNFSLGHAPADVVGRLLGDAADAEAGARMLIDHAFEGRAGDNVAVALAGPLA